MKKAIISIAFLMISVGCLKAQISIGGKPQNIEIEKNTSAKTVKMPNFAQQKSLLIDDYKSEKKLKSLKFAHSFNVNLSPKNSGVWVDNNDDISIWQLEIVSEGAYSINLIFNQFKLPEQAKLFIFNKQQKHFLGAFTANNNKVSEKFAVAPIRGDKITVQYEVPTSQKNRLPFVIKKVNHDYVGILDLSNPRRPLKTSGYCNINVNCFTDSIIQNLRDASCRIIIDGQELCSGTLLNNTAQDQTPYVLSSSHCYEEWEFAETSVYTFNYQSPFCGEIDGDTYQAISGSDMIAKFDSIDHALVKLSVIPPPEFHAFYAGWDRLTNFEKRSISIHHPKGDIKKIAIDEDAPKITNYDSDRLSKIFWKIGDWEQGVTEQGSSGAGLFNKKNYLIGALTGGQANCRTPVNDYYYGFSFAWDYKSEDSLQLKKWLDPLNTGVKQLQGARFYEKKDQCRSFTNLQANDSLQAAYIDDENKELGFWGGSNKENITEFTERFVVPNASLLSAVSIGFEKIKSYHFYNPSNIQLKVYKGSNKPAKEIFSKLVSVNTLQDSAMNFIPVEPAIAIPDTFFVGFELFGITPPDTVIMMQSVNTSDKNYFYFKKDNSWYDYREYNPQQTIVGAFEVFCCNFSTDSALPIAANPQNVRIYPNPTNGIVKIETNNALKTLSVQVADILGRTVKTATQKLNNKMTIINLKNKTPGIYFVTVQTEKGVINQKVSYVP